MTNRIVRARPPIKAGRRVKPKPVAPAPIQNHVFIIGAGFSAGLGYPLVNDLLVRLWPRLNSDMRRDLGKVIAFHFPGFDPARPTSFPDIEKLLSLMTVNEKLFNSTRAAPGRLTLKKLRSVHRRLLLAITDWFHEVQNDHSTNEPEWVSSIVTDLKHKRAVIISFNWDLVLDALLFDDPDNLNYGFDGSAHGPLLLKPHGSLNWFRGKYGKAIKEDRKVLLHEESSDPVYRFLHFRSPRGKRSYMPLIIPPIFSKSFARPIFRDLWRRSVSEISRAKTVTFLGYSLPDADLHSRYVLRCGFDNQIQGELLADGSRATPTGACPVTIVNPDIGAARRLESTAGPATKTDWKPLFVKDWAEDTL